MREEFKPQLDQTLPAPSQFHALKPLMMAPSEGFGEGVIISLRWLLIGHQREGNLLTLTNENLL